MHGLLLFVAALVGAIAIAGYNATGTDRTVEYPFNDWFLAVFVSAVGALAGLWVEGLLR